MLWMAAEAHHGAGFTTHHMVMLGSSLLVFFFIIITAMMARGGIGVVPSAWGAVYEHIFDWLDGLAQDLMGKEGRTYVPFAMSLFIFVLVSNWSGLLPIPILEHGGEHVTYEAPSTSFNTTLALALISFLAFNWFGLKKRIFPPKQEAHAEHTHHDHDHHHHNPGGLAGLGTWIAHFWQPTPQLWSSMEGVMRWALVPLLAVLFIMLNIVEEVARIMSLSIRLYGNIFGEHTVKANLLKTLYDFGGMMVTGFSTGNVGAGLGYGVMAVLLWGAAIFATCLGALAGFIQAMIFAVLTLSYIGHAVADEH